LGKVTRNQAIPRTIPRKIKTMAGIGDLARDATDSLRKRTNKTDVKVDSADVKDIFAALIARTKAGETVSIQGLGNFRVVDRKATTARNPKTGETFPVGPTKRMKFTASKTLKQNLNQAAS